LVHDINISIKRSKVKYVRELIDGGNVPPAAISTRRD